MSYTVSFCTTHAKNMALDKAFRGAPVLLSNAIGLFLLIHCSTQYNLSVVEQALLPVIKEWVQYVPLDWSDCP